MFGKQVANLEGFAGKRESLRELIGKFGELRRKKQTEQTVKRLSGMRDEYG